MRLTSVRERSASNRISAGLRALGVRVNGSRIDLPYAARSEKIEIRTTDPMDLWSNVIDSADDKSALEIFGFEPDLDSEPPDRIVVNMAGLSAAHAKLRKACDDSSSVDRGCSVGDLSPRCMPDALRSWSAMPSTPDGQTASPSH